MFKLIGHIKLQIKIKEIFEISKDLLKILSNLVKNVYFEYYI